MKQTVGNVGILNLLNATEESVKSYDKIGNVGVVLYKAGQSHLLAALNIGNIGKTVEVPDEYSYYNGILTVDAAYISSISKPLKMVISGIVIIGHDVKKEQLENGLLDFIVNGEIYAPPYLTGAVSQVFGGGSFTVNAYEGTPPRFENGNIVLSNSFLEAAEEPVHLVVNGKLTMPKELDSGLFMEKIKKIEVNGMVSVHEEQAALLHKKMDSAPNGVIQVIPAGYRVLNKTLRLNSRTIRSFREEKILTKKPLIFEKDVSREAFGKAVSRIDSKSFILCHEEVEDLVFEKLDRLETEILSYANRFALVEGEEAWANSQFQSMTEPVALVVDGLLKLDDDVSEEILDAKVETVDLFGEIRVGDSKIKGILQNKIRVNEGRMTIKEERQAADNQPSESNNVGELSL